VSGYYPHTLKKTTLCNLDCKEGAIIAQFSLMKSGFTMRKLKYFMQTFSFVISVIANDRFNKLRN
jgi:hypothetical protein